MIHHNVQTKQDLELLSHEKTVEKETEIIQKSTFFKKIPITKEQVQHIENITCNCCSLSLDKVE